MNTRLQQPMQFSLEKKKEILEYLSRKKTMKEPFKCTPKVQAKWIFTRNVVFAAVKLNLVLREVVLYGTSEHLLDISRGIQKIRDFMIPDSSNHPVKK